eukprot:TRINITY_DN15012_c0_g1_i1.p1 TRINITY_DN15012_c0_g1~~TRINITY_DN15012_c0_g1_i1.p1  ORF type:complete len:625 (+),score=104.48 TRINITY_DN15012_c0_g1_i1:33-1877(+)
MALLGPAFSARSSQDVWRPTLASEATTTVRRPSYSWTLWPWSFSGATSSSSSREGRRSPRVDQAHGAEASSAATRNRPLTTQLALAAAGVAVTVSRLTGCHKGSRRWTSSSMPNRVSCQATATSSKKKAKKVRLSADIPSGMDFYSVLEVDKYASADEIRAAYKRVIRQNHPDVNASPEAAERFLQAQEAFRWLSDPKQREVYDGVGSKFGQDAIYDYTDEPILGNLSEIHQIQELYSAIDLVNQCRKHITTKRAVKVDLTIKDIRKRYRKNGTQRVMFVRDFFCKAIRNVLQYPKLIQKLHPFERISIELALTAHMQKTGLSFGKMLGTLKELRKQIHDIGSGRAYGAKTAERGRVATFIADEGIEQMFELVTSYEPVIQQFIAAQRVILKAPCIDLDKPTVVFVGAPNVGKSSLVRSLSTGRPEVNDYCYTTQQLTIGHLWHFIAGTPLLIQGQIVDSPGLREGPGGNHNLMDQLTMGSMQHLPTGVVYVFDPYPLTHGILDLEAQIRLRESLRRKFPQRPWLDVVTKIDREEDLCKENIEKLHERYPDILEVSAMDGAGLDVLNMEVRGLLEEMTRVVRQLQRSKIRQLRMGSDEEERGYLNKEALVLRAS